MGKRSQTEARNLELKGYTSDGIHRAFHEKRVRLGLTQSEVVHRLAQWWSQLDDRTAEAKSEWDNLGQIFNVGSFGGRVNYGSTPARQRL